MYITFFKHAKKYFFISHEKQDMYIGEEVEKRYYIYERCLYYAIKPKFYHVTVKSKTNSKHKLKIVIIFQFTIILKKSENRYTNV